MQKGITRTATAVIAAVAAATVFAHGDKAVPALGPNGGEMKDAESYHLELVVKPQGVDVRENPIVLYVTDAKDKKVDTAGAKGTANVLAGKIKATSTLQPDGDNRLKGIAKFAPDPEMKVVVSVTLPGKQPMQARFTPLASSKK